MKKLTLILFLLLSINSFGRVRFVAPLPEKYHTEFKVDSVGTFLLIAFEWDKWIVFYSPGDHYGETQYMIQNAATLTKKAAGLKFPDMRRFTYIKHSDKLRIEHSLGVTSLRNRSTSK